MLNLETLPAAAREMGMEAAVISTADIVFDHSFLKYCEENLCGNYNRHWCCPPVCGTPAELQARVMRYENALVLTKQYIIDNWKNIPAVKAAKDEHNNRMLELCRRLRREGTDCLLCGCGNCNLCEHCAFLDGNPCVNPDESFCCLSAYCVNVSELGKSSGLLYEWGGNQMTVYGFIAF